MPNTDPALDEPGVLARIRAAAVASGSPVELLAHGAVTVGRAGEQLAAIGELADAGVVGFSDDGSPVRTAPILRSALAYAGSLGLPIVDHAEDPSLTAGAEANDGYVATVLGLRGWPPAGEESAVGRDLAVLADVVRDVPGARLHLTHLSTAGALELVRQAKARGLPVTCDVTPHHLALSDEWLAGARRWAWDAGDDPWSDGALVGPPYVTSLRVNPPLRARGDAAACIEALLDGTADAVVTDHAPHTEVDKAVEFGLAANGISGLETALGILLAAVDAGRLPLLRAIVALTAGPMGLLGGRSRRMVAGLVEGSKADLVVFDRSASWTVTPESLASRGKNSPLIGTRVVRVASSSRSRTVVWPTRTQGTDSDGATARRWRAARRNGETPGRASGYPSAMGKATLNPDFERRSFWQATMPALPDRSGRPLPAGADVVVIGGGYAGINAARELARRGVKVTLLEAEHLGSAPPRATAGSSMPATNGDLAS